MIPIVVFKLFTTVVAKCKYSLVNICWVWFFGLVIGIVDKVDHCLVWVYVSLIKLIISLFDFGTLDWAATLSGSSLDQTRSL